MVEPQYQELLKKDIPNVDQDGVHVAVIAGNSYGASVIKSHLPVLHVCNVFIQFCLCTVLFSLVSCAY